MGCQPWPLSKRQASLSQPGTGRLAYPSAPGGVGVCVVVSIVELHLAMQKMRFLLTDCARRGGRLWVLVNAELIASELRLCLGSVAAAMDVLPTSIVGASVESGELGRLVSDQAWRAVVRPDAGDKLAVRSIRSIKDTFKRGVASEADDVMMCRIARGPVAATARCRGTSCRTRGQHA